MSASQPASICSIPEEIQDQIIRMIPVKDLLNIILLSQAFRRQATPHLYHSVHYLKECTPPDEHDFALVTKKEGSYDPTRSARIIRPAEFLRTLTEVPRLLDFVNEGSLSIQESSNDEEAKALEKCLRILNTSTFQLSLANKHANMALMGTVTRLDIAYPTEDYLQKNRGYAHIRDEIHSLFSIAALRHLCLRRARSWHAFSPKTDDTRAGTSNIISLSLLDTIPMDTDLREILTWPRRLKCFHHESEPDERSNAFQNYFGRGKIASSKRFLVGIASQRESLEELAYNHGDDKAGTDGSTFSPDLMRKFTKLTHLYVPRECLTKEDGTPHPLYMVLPPNLQELYLDQDDYIEGGDISDAEYEGRLRRWLQDIADHKAECFPSLNAVVFWQYEWGYHMERYREASRKVLERLSLGRTYEEAGIRLEFIFRDSRPDV